MEKFTHKNIRKITKTGGGSYYVVIPKELMRELKWKERQKVVVSKTAKGLVIKDWKKS